MVKITKLFALPKFGSLLGSTSASLKFLSYFFVKKIPLSRRMGYVMGGWISVSGSVDQ